MDPKIIEAAAIALLDACNRRPGGWQTTPDDIKELYRHDVRAALDAALSAGLEVAKLPSVEREDGARPLPIDRDTLGRFVREAWVRWAQTQDNPKPSWLVPYDDLAEPDKEADRQIGEAVARWTLIYDAASRSLSPDREAAIRREALMQARGALMLDAMLDEDGRPYGTTVTALESIDAALSAREVLCDDEGCPHHGTPHFCINVAAIRREALEEAYNVARYARRSDSCEQIADAILALIATPDKGGAHG